MKNVMVIHVAGTGRTGSHSHTVSVCTYIYRQMREFLFACRGKFSIIEHTPAIYRSLSPPVNRFFCTSPSKTMYTNIDSSHVYSNENANLRLAFQLFSLSLLFCLFFIFSSASPIVYGTGEKITKQQLTLTNENENGSEIKCCLFLLCPMWWKMVMNIKWNIDNFYGVFFLFSFSLARFLIVVTKFEKCCEYVWGHLLKIKNVYILCFRHLLERLWKCVYRKWQLKDFCQPELRQMSIDSIRNGCGKVGDAFTSYDHSSNKPNDRNNRVGKKPLAKKAHK